MTTPPELWLLVGGNGAGKSTFYERFLARRKIPLINADNIARSLWPEHPEKHSYEAALIAEKERFRLLEERQSFCFETVFSHPSKVDFVGAAKAAGFRVRLFYFHLEAAAGAIADAGLQREDIDGLISYRHFPAGTGEQDVTPYLIAQHLGISPAYMFQDAN